MKRRVLTGLGVAALLVTSGCYHYRVAPARAAPADDGHSTTLHSIAWGLVQSSAEEPECQGNGAAEVVAHTNFAYVLLGVVTLGVWVPLELEWKCAKDPLRVDTGMR